MLASFLCGEFLLHILCCLLLSLFFLFFIWGVSLTHPVLDSFLSGDFLLHIPCWLHFYLGSFSYTSRADFIFYLGSFSYTSHASFIIMPGISLTRPVLSSILCTEIPLHHPHIFYSGDFLLHIPCWLHFCLWSFSYTFRVGFIFMRVVSAGFIFTWGVSLTHPVLASFLSEEFLLHIPGWLHFYLGSFSYTSRAGLILIWGVFLTHSVLASFVSVEFLLHTPFWLHFYLGSFSYTSPAGFIFIWGVSLTF